MLLEAAQNIQHQARDGYENLPIDGNAKTEYGTPLAPEQLDALRQYVEMNRESLALIFGAMEHPYLCFPHDRYSPYKSHYYVEMHELARLLSCFMLDAAIQGDMELLYGCFVVGLRLSGPLSYGADFISELVSLGILHMMVANIEYALFYAVPPQPTIRAWQQILADFGYSAIKQYQGMLKNMVATDFPSITFRGPLFSFGSKPDLALKMARSVVDWSQCIYFAERQFTWTFEQLVEIGNEDVYGAAIFSVQNAGNERYWLLTTPFSPVWVYTRQQLYQSPSQFIAKANAAQAALASLLFLNDHGYMPDALVALIPDYLETWPRDPFTPDQMIRYRIDRDEAVFYSIGRNEQDDGGVCRHDNCRDCDDIAFRVTIPPVSLNSR